MQTINVRELRNTIPHLRETLEREHEIVLVSSSFCCSSMRLRISWSYRRERRRFHATSRLLCWLRPSWHWTTMLVGICVRRTAESVLLMCWPPAPLAR